MANTNVKIILRVIELFFSLTRLSQRDTDRLIPQNTMVVLFFRENIPIAGLFSPVPGQGLRPTLVKNIQRT